MKILFTGGSSYFGSRILNQLIAQKKHSVTIFSRSTLHEYSPKIQIHVDLSKNSSYNQIKNQSFDLVVHCAGYVPKNKSEDLEKNAELGNTVVTQKLLEKAKFKKLIYISTCEVYGPQNSPLITEDLEPMPISNYAKSKFASEILVNKFSEQHQIPAAILRITTIIGEKDKINRAIPNFIDSAVLNKEINVNGSENIRDYIYVNDAAEAVNLVINNFQPGTFNISSGIGISIGQVAKQIKEALHSHSKIVSFDTGKISSTIYSNTKLVLQFKFKQNTPFKTAVQLIGRSKKYIFFDLDGTLISIYERWYKIHLDLAKAFEFTPLPEKEYIKQKRMKVSEQQILEQTDISPNDIHSYNKKRLDCIEDPEYLKLDILKKGAEVLLKKLYPVATLILITKRKKEAACRAQLKDMKLETYFDEIIVTKQPKIDIIRSMVDSAEPVVVYSIGDSDDDNHSKEKKITTILLADGVRDKKQLETLKDVQIVDKLDDLRSILL